MKQIIVGSFWRNWPGREPWKIINVAEPYVDVEQGEIVKRIKIASFVTTYYEVGSQQDKNTTEEFRKNGWLQ